MAESVTTQVIRDADRLTYDSLLTAQRELELFGAEKSARQARIALRALERLQTACGEEIVALQRLIERAKARRPELETAIRAAQEVQPFHPELVPLAMGPLYEGDYASPRRRFPERR